MNLTRLLSIIAILSFSCGAGLSKKITCSVLSLEDGKPIEGAIATLFCGDSISATTQSAKDGSFSFNVSDQTRSEISVTSIGFKEKEVSFFPDTISSPLLFRLEEDAIVSDLDEFVVEADKSNLVKRTANGQIFYLSKRAKAERNPFMALKEIPLLRSDESNSEIKMLNGNKPLILIDGNRVNSGIAPILPADIESVEVITAVPARYLQEGYRSIVNIRLKKRRDPYVWVQLATRHDIPTYYGFGVGYFEVGNEKFSLYGRANYTYTHDGKTESSVTRSNTGYSQQYDLLSKVNDHNWNGDFLLKYMPTSRDYLALQGYYKHAHDRTSGEAEGNYITDVEEAYGSESSDLNKSTLLTSNLYYKHSFEQGGSNNVSMANDLEVRMTFNTNNNRLDSHSSEYIGSDNRDYFSLFDNKRYSGGVSIDYQRQFESGLSFSVGNHWTYNSDRVRQETTGFPDFHHRKLNGYLFGSFSWKLRNLLYMISGGGELIQMKAGDADNSYLKPRASASLTWIPNNNHSVQLSYELTNLPPDISKLNPYNTSTDSLVVNSGNPYLLPEMYHFVTFNYTFNKDGLYLIPKVYYEYYSDQIQPDGYTENGVYHSSFRNAGHYQFLGYYLGLSYRWNWLNILTYTGIAESRFLGEKPKRSFYSSTSIDIFYKKIYFNLSFDIDTYIYTANTTQRNHNAVFAQTQINYNFTPDFYIAVALQNWTGTRNYTTTLKQGSYNYQAHVYDRGAGKGFMPWILIRYTFRHNQKRKIKLGNNLFEEEKGLKLK